MTNARCPDLTSGDSAFSLNLRRQAIFSVPDAANVRIACVEGSIWITLDNDPRDVTLDSCGVFTTPEHRRAIVYALQPSVISVSAKNPARIQSRKSAPALVLQMEPA